MAFVGGLELGDKIGEEPGEGGLVTTDYACFAHNERVAPEITLTLRGHGRSSLGPATRMVNASAARQQRDGDQLGQRQDAEQGDRHEAQEIDQVLLDEVSLSDLALFVRLPAAGLKQLCDEDHDIGYAVMRDAADGFGRDHIAPFYPPCLRVACRIAWTSSSGTLTGTSSSNASKARRPSLSFRRSPSARTLQRPRAMQLFAARPVDLLRSCRAKSRHVGAVLCVPRLRSGRTERRSRRRTYDKAAFTHPLALLISSWLPSRSFTAARYTAESVVLQNS